MEWIQEEERRTPVAGTAEVIVAGGGPAGVCAAVAAARSGADTLLLEAGGCLGGMWTAGCLGWLLDGMDKPKDSLTGELIAGLQARGQMDGKAFDVEGMKLFLEEWCRASKVRLRYFTTLADVIKEDGRITHAVTVSKSGREAWRGKVFIDCTGDGDLGFLAGNPYETGHPENGRCQPMSLLALLTGPDPEAVRPYTSEGTWSEIAERFAALLREDGYQPSYQGRALFHLGGRLFFLMANHQYGVSGISADDLTEATIKARAEINRQVATLRKHGGIWKDVQLVATAEKIGVRESRRLLGRYKVTLEDLVEGRRHEDAVARVNFGIDVHQLQRGGKNQIDKAPVKSQPYDVPLRALISANVENLLFAGRCISGDFFAHSSYRVTGNAARFGEAAGRLAALSCRLGIPVEHVDFNLVSEALSK